MTVYSDQTPTWLYRLYDARGQVLYVGITADVSRRWQQHENNQFWWPDVAKKTLSWFPGRPLASAAEVRLIRTLQPIHNVQRDASGNLRIAPVTYPVKTEAERVASALREEIADGRYEPGAFLPRQEIARRFWVPFALMSHVFSVLEAEGVLIGHGARQRTRRTEEV